MPYQWIDYLDASGCRLFRWTRVPSKQHHRMREWCWDRRNWWMYMHFSAHLPPRKKKLHLLRQRHGWDDLRLLKPTSLKLDNALPFQRWTHRYLSLLIFWRETQLSPAENIWLKYIFVEEGCYPHSLYRKLVEFIGLFLLNSAHKCVFFKQDYPRSCNKFCEHKQTSCFQSTEKHRTLFHEPCMAWYMSLWLHGQLGGQSMRMTRLMCEANSKRVQWWPSSTQMWWLKSHIEDLWSIYSEMPSQL